MKVIIRLLKEESVVDETQFPYENLTKQKMEQFLQSTYGLTFGYEITYVDNDGDEIMVEYDDDYEVAKLTHQQDMLILSVKVSNQQWLAQFDQNPTNQQQQKIIEQLEQKNDNKTEPTDPIVDEIQQIDKIKIENQIKPQIQLQNQTKTNQIKNNENKDQTQSINQQTQSQENEKNQEAKEETSISLRPKVENETKINPKVNNKRKTQTQLSSSESQNQNQNQSLLPLIATKTDDLSQTNQNTLQTPTLIISNPHQQQLKQIQIKQTKKLNKKQKKPKKPSENEKSQKKKLTLTEKQLKKLIKKQVIKLIPDISAQVKKHNQNQNLSINKLSCSLQKISLLNCTKCEQKLSIPFYINSSQGLKLCQQCEEQDTTFVPLIKIRDPIKYKSLVWAQPLCQINEKPEQNPVKFYTNLKKSLGEQFSKKMDERIKHAKKEEKIKKNEFKMSNRKEKIQKFEQKIVQNPLNSASSSSV